jgi:cytochrome c oxidase cbb3-type subunit 3
MRFIHSIKKKIALSLAAMFMITTVMAQQTTGATDNTGSSSYNMLVYLLVSVAIVLAFVIWGLAQALITLSRQVVEKNKTASKATITTVIICLLLVSQNSFAQTTDAAVKVLPNYGGLSATTYYLLLSVIAAELIAILFLVFSVKGMYAALLPEKKVAPVKEKAPALKKWWSGLDAKIFTRAIPIEREADVMLDHDYDGIRELDNALPPWWKYGFYVTILVACIYLLNFHVFGTGKNPTEEYAVEMQDAQIEKDIYEANNKDKIDENNVPMADANGLATAKEIFTTKCFACHGKSGEGGAGPNLTDDYWLHKGSLNDIFHTIKNGYADKGMQSWAKEYTPKEISFLASYIKTLHGTNPPNAKSPQGDLFVDASAPAADSAKKKIDSTSLKKLSALNN